jgi:putative phage-type endonuclease
MTDESDKQVELTITMDTDSLDSFSSDEETEQETMEEEDLIACIPTIYELTDEYIRFHILDMHEPKFHNIMNNEICDLLLMEWENTDICSEDQKAELLRHCETITNNYFELGIASVPPRSNSQHHRPQKQISKEIHQKTIESILAIHQPEQRTTEWYEFRHNLLSASSLGKIFGTEASQNRLIYEKCQPLNTHKFSGATCVSSPMHWGQKYEPLSVALYEEMYDTKVGEFGCIQHKDYSFIGASPDGIVIKKDCPRYGRMVEIKNIVNRPITGIPLKDYWIQMQIQMEVCNLEHCDFLETRFKEYENEEDFWKEEDDSKKRGVILYFVERVSICDTESETQERRPRSNTYPRMDEEGPNSPKGFALAQEYSGIPRYEYMPLDIPLEKEAINQWIEQTRARLRRSWSLYTPIYWYLDELSCVVVQRNHLWFEQALPQIESTWNTILKERETGCEHRAPSKKVVKIMSLEVVEKEGGEKEVRNFPFQKGVCLVKL